MRGKPTTTLFSGSPIRSIPAYAGKTVCRGLGREPNQEHPRVCGENLSTLDQAGNGQGTSPRMRGKRFNPRTLWDGPRNIPAHAGKTLQPAHFVGRTQEHPRACGENRAPTHAWGSSSGTSPRMRGKPRTRFCEEILKRNIPAHAGKTGLTLSTARSNHGTSPRMRGKLNRRGKVAAWAGNIPAHAGKTYTSMTSAHMKSEHPRACGENRV